MTRKKRIAYSLLLCAIGVGIAGLQCGLTPRYYNIQTSKVSEGKNLRILMLSDLHSCIYGKEQSQDVYKRQIDSGLNILNERIAAADGKELPAADAFQLYDTYGFPIDLTLEILEEQGMTTNRDEFDRLMNEQRERAREDRKKMGDLGWQSEDLGLDLYLIHI